MADASESDTISDMPFDLPSSSFPSPPTPSHASPAQPQPIHQTLNQTIAQKNPGLNSETSRFVDCDSRYWFIDGSAYDLSSFKHPGGEHMLLLGKGRDCTALFNTHSLPVDLCQEPLTPFCSYHIHNDKHRTVLKKFLVPVSTTPSIVHPAPSRAVLPDPLLADLQEMVRQYCKTHGSSKMTRTRWALFLLIAAAFSFSFFKMLATGTLLWTVACPILATLTGLQVAHDASHGAASSRPSVNFFLSFVSIPWTYNTVPWFIQHVMQHHIYTNEREDVDLYHLKPIGRMSPLSPYNPLNRFNLLYVFLVQFPLVGVFETIVYPLRLAADPNSMYKVARNKTTFIRRYTPHLLCQSFASILVTAVMWYSHGFIPALIPWIVSGFYFTLVTQGAHLQHGCHSQETRPWSLSQIDHAVDFSSSSLFWNVVTGGLNTQSLHHVLPSVHHCHYPRLYPEFLRVCARHGVRPKNARNAAVFVRGYLEWISSLSREQV